MPDAPEDLAPRIQSLEHGMAVLMAGQGYCLATLAHHEAQLSAVQQYARTMTELTASKLQALRTLTERLDEAPPAPPPAQEA